MPVLQLTGLRPINSLKWRATLAMERDILDQTGRVTGTVVDETIEDVRCLSPKEMDHCKSADLVTKDANWLLRIGDAVFACKDKPDFTSLTPNTMLALDMNKFGTRYYNMSMIATLDLVKVDTSYVKAPRANDD